MQKENAIFWPDRFQDAQAHLFSTRPEFEALTPEAVDFEMSFPRRRDRLKLTRLTQEGLEHFVRRYGADYRVLYLDDCTRLRELSALGKLPGLEAVRIDWCRKLDRLWDMSGNRSLRVLSISDAKKLAEDPRLLQTSKTLEEVRLWGPLSGGTYTLCSMDCFRGMRSLRRIDLNWIKLSDRNMDALDSLPGLEEFHFDPGMLTTEEIAWIVAKYPRLCGDCLRPYDDTGYGIGEVRVCGSRKPTLQLPKQQGRLDRYVSEFRALVEQYRKM